MKSYKNMAVLSLTLVVGALSTGCGAVKMATGWDPMSMGKPKQTQEKPIPVNRVVFNYGLNAEQFDIIQVPALGPCIQMTMVEAPKDQVSESHSGWDLDNLLALSGTARAADAGKHHQEAGRISDSVATSGNVGNHTSSVSSYSYGALWVARDRVGKSIKFQDFCGPDGPLMMPKSDQFASK